MNCTPGIPATTQIPRLLNRQYEAVVRDLLGVTTVGTDGKTIGQRLIADSDGPMTPDAWRIYEQVAGEIAKAVMSGPNKSRFISCDPAAEASCMSNTIKIFGRKAFRRPLTNEEVARFEKLGQTTPKGTPAEVAEATLQAFLMSPSFLLIPELNATPSPDGMGVQLSSHETAARLSFLLWGTVPDEELNDAADADQLKTKEQILAQAQRMVKVQDKTGALVAMFHREWAQMNNEAQHWWEADHDTTKYPLYDRAKKASWQAEMDSFFQDVAFSGGSFKDLLLSNVAYVNKDNAAIYGLDPASYGTELKRTELDPAQRPGFLTRVGFLSSYASFDATSPILRGAYMLTYLMGANPGPPIPGAEMAKAEGTFSTQRAYVTELTKGGACVGCHSAINPPGFVMENYDAVGKWQTMDPRGGAIDASVTTAEVDIGGVKKMISSPRQLMEEIANLPQAREIYAQTWVSYAFGRQKNANDQCVVDQLNMKLSQSGYSIINLLTDLTQADSFRLRVRATP